MWNLMAREIQQAGSHLHPVRSPEGLFSDADLHTGGERTSSDGSL